MTYPRSPKTLVGGLAHLGRLIDKIRLRHAGHIQDYNYLTVGFDKYLLEFLNVNGQELEQRVLQGGTDEEILQWCFRQGRRPGEEEIEIWNGFMVAYGWRDRSTAELSEVKRKRGFGDRDDIQSWFDFHRADEAE